MGDVAQRFGLARFSREKRVENARFPGPASEGAP